MNRTVLILGGAAALALVALVAGMPRLGSRGDGPPPLQPPPTSAGGGSLGVSARLSHPLVATGAQEVFATVEVKAVEAPGRARASVNLALVIDRSGSMAGVKLEQAKRAARELVALLGPADRLTVVHYGSDVRTFEGLLATPENKPRLLAFIDGIWDDGGTNIGAALVAARDALLQGSPGFGVNRLVLVSDGQPTEGLTDLPGLEAVVRGVRARGVSVSSLGVGEDFNEQLMQALAEVGAGAYGYLQDAAQLTPVLERELAAAGTQVARLVSVSFRVPRGVTLVRLLGRGKPVRQPDGDGELVTVALPDFAAGQAERLVAQLALPGGADGEQLEVAALALRYQDLLAGGPREAGLRLSARASADPAAVDARRDPQGVVLATRARAAANAEAAAQRVGEGDLAGARALLGVNQALFEEAGSVAGAAAVADDLAATRAGLAETVGVKTEAELKRYKKAVNQKARKDYGQLGSTY